MRFILSSPEFLEASWNEQEVNITSRARIAIVGRNGAGKTTLLASLKEAAERQHLKVGYVPQLITDYPELSGGERFNRKLTETLALDPALLLLDEPTNHLDVTSKTNLTRKIARFGGSVVVVSHDLALLADFNEFWLVNQGNLTVFHGRYEELRETLTREREQLTKNRTALRDQMKQLKAQQQASREQEVAKNRNAQNRLAKHQTTKLCLDATINRGQQQSGAQVKALGKQLASLSEQLGELYQPREIVPKFNFTGNRFRAPLVIQEGACGYQKEEPVLTHLNLSTIDSFALIGDNASGKTTFLRALLGDPAVWRTGDWQVTIDRAYVDQHYSLLTPDVSVYDLIYAVTPHLTDRERREHLNRFLFQNNQSVNQLAGTLSGGERVRLCLALIAAKTPKLLILDEITNNLDFETRQQLLTVLKAYPGQLILVSHDEEFIKELNLARKVVISREIRDLL